MSYSFVGLLTNGTLNDGGADPCAIRAIYHVGGDTPSRPPPPPTPPAGGDPPPPPYGWRAEKRIPGGWPTYSPASVQEAVTANAKLWPAHQWHLNDGGADPCAIRAIYHVGGDPPSLRTLRKTATASALAANQRGAFMLVSKVKNCAWDNRSHGSRPTSCAGGLRRCGAR